jgi:hypothetical protein
LKHTPSAASQPASQERPLGPTSNVRCEPQNPVFSPVFSPV